MEKTIFKHKVSKGSRYNQVYIPTELKEHFQPGDLVEVSLLKKESVIHYSPNLEKLEGYREDLVKKILFFLSNYKKVKQVFVIGSFLTKKGKWNDIDILVISEEISEEEIHNHLVDKFGFVFHVIVISQESFNKLEKICPLTRSMLHYFCSNKEYHLPKERILDKKHINFLLMLPEDLLEINLKGRVFYDCIRRLITIDRFLQEKDESIKLIDEELKKLLGDKLFINLSEMELIEEGLLKDLRKIIKEKLLKIGRLLNVKESTNK